MLTTRSRLDALEAALRAAWAEDRRAIREDAQQAIAALKEEMGAAIAGIEPRVEVLAEAARRAGSDLDRLREQGERDRQLIGALREGLDRLGEDASDQRMARERLQTTVTKLERRMEQHAEDLQIAAAALLERIGTTRP